MEQVSGAQLIITVLASNAALVGVLVYLVQRFGPNLLGWMQGRIDTKNGEISALVEETKGLAGEISRLAQAICGQVEESRQAQEALAGRLEATCGRYTAEIDRLVERIDAALERAA